MDNPVPVWRKVITPTRGPLIVKGCVPLQRTAAPRIIMGHSVGIQSTSGKRKWHGCTDDSVGAEVTAVLNERSNGKE
jgi:hypothetical protein